MFSRYYGSKLEEKWEKLSTESESLSWKNKPIFESLADRSFSISSKIALLVSIKKILFPVFISASSYSFPTYSNPKKSLCSWVTARSVAIVRGLVFTYIKYSIVNKKYFDVKICRSRLNFSYTICWRELTSLLLRSIFSQSKYLLLSLGSVRCIFWSSLFIFFVGVTSSVLFFYR